MRGLIISDTHGRHHGYEKALEQVGKIDFLIHLGDTEGGEDYIEATACCPCYIVAGNNDFFCDLHREMEIEIEGHRLFLAHGHNYRVSLGPERIMEEGKSRGCDIVLYGHIHRPVILKKDGVLAVNPGSLSFPRQEGRKRSYAVMEIPKDGEVSVEIFYL